VVLAVKQWRNINRQVNEHMDTRHIIHDIHAYFGWADRHQIMRWEMVGFVVYIIKDWEKMKIITHPWWDDWYKTPQITSVMESWAGSKINLRQL